MTCEREILLRGPNVLLRWRPVAECMAQAFILDDRCGVDALVLVEGEIGKHTPFGAHLQPAVSEVIEVDVLAGKRFANLASFQDDLLSLSSGEFQRVTVGLGRGAAVDTGEVHACVVSQIAMKGRSLKSMVLI